MKIREYRSEDWPDILCLWQLTGLGSSNRGDNTTVIENTIAMGGKFLIMENEQSKIIGTSWITQDGRRCYIHHFGILPMYQGKGLSHELLEETIKCCKEIGLQVKLEVARDNFKAISLYKKHGFSELGPYDGYIIRDFAIK